MGLTAFVIYRCPVNKLPTNGYKHTGNGSPSGAGEQAVGQLIDPGLGSFLFKGTGAAVKNGFYVDFGFSFSFRTATTASLLLNTRFCGFILIVMPSGTVFSA